MNKRLYRLTEFSVDESNGWFNVLNYRSSWVQLETVSHEAHTPATGALALMQGWVRFEDLNLDNFRVKAHALGGPRIECQEDLEYLLRVGADVSYLADERILERKD